MAGMKTSTHTVSLNGANHIFDRWSMERRAKHIYSGMVSTLPGFATWSLLKCLPINILKTLRLSIVVYQLLDMDHICTMRLSKQLGSISNAYWGRSVVRCSFTSTLSFSIKVDNKCLPWWKLKSSIKAHGYDQLNNVLLTVAEVFIMGGEAREKK